MPILPHQNSLQPGSDVQHSDVIGREPPASVYTDAAPAAMADVWRASPVVLSRRPAPHAPSYDLSDYTIAHTPRAIDSGAPSQAAIPEVQSAQPCAVWHEPCPVLPEDIALCAATARAISGFPLVEMPEVCVPNGSDFTASLLRNRHTTYLPLSEGEQQACRTLDKTGTGVAAVYCITSKQILLHPSVGACTTAIGDPWPATSLLTHEMTHAAQASLFPEGFTAHWRASRDALACYEAPTSGFFDSLRMARAATRIMQPFFNWSVVIEGHATWVQTVAAETVFQKKTTLTARLAYASYSLLQHASLSRVKDAYKAGYALMCEIDVLQRELQVAPFKNYAGEAVTLAPRLRDNGLVKLLFLEPALVDILMPQLHTAWLPSNQNKVDMTPLRELVKRLPGHVPLVTVN